MPSDEPNPKLASSRLLNAVSAFIGAAMLLLVALTMIPVTPESARFVSVTSPNQHTDTTATSRLPGRPNGDHVIHNDKLYLKVQATRAALVLVTTIYNYPWTVSKLQQFRKEHPELEPYFPAPDKPNAGIAWISD